MALAWASLSSRFEEVPVETRQWKPEQAPQATVMNSAGNRVPREVARPVDGKLRLRREGRQRVFPLDGVIRPKSAQHPLQRVLQNQSSAPVPMFPPFRYGPPHGSAASPGGFPCPAS